MAEALKDQFFQKTFFQQLSERISSIHQQFSSKEFENLLYNESWEDMALMDRMRHATRCLHQCLPSDYEEALHIITKIAPDFGGFDAMMFPDFVQQFGQEHYDQSIEALVHLTKYSSSEFAIRPFIIQNPEATMLKMQEWSIAKNEHVRRFSSEGCRPRLPWAMALPAFKKDPGLILPILENLKSDRSLYVRKSVSNNINDITKDNPETVLKMVTPWQNHASSETKWIIKQGLRGLIKAGNENALQLLGFKPANIKLQHLKLATHKINMGETLHFNIRLQNKENQPQNVMVDYVIDFMKSNGKTAPKTFKLKAISLNPNESIALEKSHKIYPITTRKYYPGMHQIGIQVNGKVLGKVDFELAIPH